MFQKLELVVEMIDGTDSPALSNATECAGCEDHNPQYGYQNQQDHYRRSPTPSFVPPHNTTEYLDANGGWSGRMKQ